MVLVMKTAVLCGVILKETNVSGNIPPPSSVSRSKPSVKQTEAGAKSEAFLLSLLFYVKCDGDIFFRNVELPPNYTLLLFGRLYHRLRFIN
jgi:hypothetical protein